MFSGFCGLFDHKRIIKKNVINHQKLIVQMSGKIIGYTKRKIYLYFERGRNNNFLEKLANVNLHKLHCLCIIA